MTAHCHVGMPQQVADYEGMVWFWIISEYFNTTQKQFPIFSSFFLFFPSQTQELTYYANPVTARI